MLPDALRLSKPCLCQRAQAGVVLGHSLALDHAFERANLAARPVPQSSLSYAERSCAHRLVQQHVQLAAMHGILRPVIAGEQAARL